MVDFSEHLRKAGIFHADPALVDKRILSQLLVLTETPGQKGIVLDEEITNQAPGHSFELGIYEPKSGLLGLIVRSKERYGRIVRLRIDRDKVPEAKRYIRYHSGRYSGYY